MKVKKVKKAVIIASTKAGVNKAYYQIAYQYKHSKKWHVGYGSYTLTRVDMWMRDLLKKGEIV